MVFQTHLNLPFLQEFGKSLKKKTYAISVSHIYHCLPLFQPLVAKTLCFLFMVFPLTLPNSQIDLLYVFTFVHLRNRQTFLSINLTKKCLLVLRREKRFINTIIYSNPTLINNAIGL